MIKYFNRHNKSYEIEKVAGGRLLKYIYTTSVGKGALELFIKKKFLSTLYGRFSDTYISKFAIPSFCKSFDIKISDFQKSINEYSSFNDFFYRKLKSSSRIICNDESSLISPCDSKLLAIEDISESSTFQIKGYEYKLEDLFKNKDLSKEYINGSCLIFRLCPSDYHRFHFFDSGYCSKSTEIFGDYYSVNPLAIKELGNIFCKNKREYSIFNSNNFGKVIYLEVGATFVGSIIQTYNEKSLVYRGDEKGYFKFGGSTVVLFFKKDTIKLDDDILYNSNLNIESSVYLGEKIGIKV